jgi:16S rRNA (cytosine967-C5)-methyltransferase
VSATPARRCAYAVVRRVFEQQAYADRAFRGEAERAALEPRDRGFAMRLAYGTVQMKATLDWVLESLARRPLEKLDPPVLAAL